MLKNKLLFESPDLPYSSGVIHNVIQIKKKLYSGRSPFQRIEVFDTAAFGRVLVLDGIFQTSEKDEFIYHEMIGHPPMFYCPLPKRALVIGGGDGGVLKEVLKHPIEKVWQVEIDAKVMGVSRKYLPSISQGAFESEKAEVIIGDGFKFIKERKFKAENFDVIILDLSDPWGPAKKLISLDFYQAIKNVLAKDGVLAVQSGSLDIQPALVSLINKRLKRVFSFVKIHRANVPLYGVGNFSITIASDQNLEKINYARLKKKFNSLSLKTRYYSPAMHQSSGILPKYLKELIE